MATRQFTLEIPVRFLLNIQASSLEQAWKIAERMTIVDAVKQHRGYTVGADWRIVERAPSAPEEGQEGGGGR